MKNRFVSSLALTLTLSVLSSTVMADTASEVRQVVLDQVAHMNQELTQDPMRLSKDGSIEFFSSGGLLTYLDRTSGGNTFEMFEGSIKHIEVVVLSKVKRRCALYQEAMMQLQDCPLYPTIALE